LQGYTRGNNKRSGFTFQNKKCLNEDDGLPKVLFNFDSLSQITKLEKSWQKLKKLESTFWISIL
jgi:hypothetical protein